MQREFTTPFQEISPKELNKCLQKYSFICRQEEATAVRSLSSKIVLRSLAIVNELKIIIFVLNYRTLLVYTKTTTHLSVGG